MSNRPPALYLLTMDYRALTMAIFWPMHNPDEELVEKRTVPVFALIDFCSGYWKAPLHDECQRLFGFMKPDGVVMPTRTSQDGANSAANFQEKVEYCFTKIRENFKAWLDNYMLFAKNEDELLQVLPEFFDICREHNHIISLPKSDFFLCDVTWCRRNIDASGVRFNRKNLSGKLRPSP